MPYADDNVRRANVRRYHAENKERVSAIKKRWQERNPEKRAAHVAVGNAVRDGRLTKTPCHCGELVVEAHHHDYSKPLDVVWLCKTHHAIIHRSL